MKLNSVSVQSYKTAKKQKFFEKVVSFRGLTCLPIKANQKEMFKMPIEKVKAFEPKIASAKEAEDFITKACEFYARYLNRQRDRGDR